MGTASSSSSDEEYTIPFEFYDLIRNKRRKTTYKCEKCNLFFVFQRKGTILENGTQLSTIMREVTHKRYHATTFNGHQYLHETFYYKSAIDL